MIVNSAMNEGLAGMQQSQKRMLQAAEDIARAGVPTEARNQQSGSLDAAVTNSGLAASDLPAQSTVGAATELDPSRFAAGDVVEPLIEQKRQQVLFDASANVVRAANENLGQLIDDLS